MCIIFLAYNIHPNYPLILLANRDEFYERKSAPAQIWKDSPEIFAGRDLVGGGTWLGITTRGRIAAVTNYREPGVPKGPVSRGDLVADFLRADLPPNEYLASVSNRNNDYSGFNLLVGEFSHSRQDLYYFSNRCNGIRKLESGIYGLSNHLLDTPWPKVRKGTERFSQFVRLPELEKQALFDLLADESFADDADLPDTGVGYEIEKALSAIFIRTPVYGTRCSTVVTFDDLFEGSLEERVFV